MALYKHLVLVFNKPVAGIFDTNTAKFNVSFMEEFVPSGPILKSEVAVVDVLQPSNGLIEYVPYNRQVVLELDNPLNNCVGKITVEYVQGLIGAFGEPVAPFVHEFEPTPMPDYYQLREYDGVSYSVANSISLKSVSKSAFEDTDRHSYVLDKIDASASTIKISYIGSIKP